MAVFSDLINALRLVISNTANTQIKDVSMTSSNELSVTDVNGNVSTYAPILADYVGNPGKLLIPLASGKTLLIQWGTYSATTTTDRESAEGIYECVTPYMISWPQAFASILYVGTMGANDVGNVGLQEQAWPFAQYHTATEGGFGLACREVTPMSGLYFAIGYA